jgi:hypothetical protein
MVIRTRFILVVTVAITTAGLAWVAVCFFPYWLKESVRRGRENRTRDQMVAVKAGTTTCIFDPVPELLVKIANNRDCVDKLTEVCITGDSTPDVSDKRFAALRRFLRSPMLC